MADQERIWPSAIGHDHRHRDPSPAGPPASRSWTYLMKPPFDPAAFVQDINRRTFLGRSAFGLGGLALASLMAPRDAAGAEASLAAAQGGRWKGVVRTPHVKVRAKRVIHLCMAGG